MQTATVNPSSSKSDRASTVNKSWLENDRRNWALLLGASFLLFFFALSSWGFIDPGDGYFSETSREMIERNDYIVPHLNYQIYFSKPILIYWLIISAYKVFGINEFAARFWSAALATVMVAVSYWTTRSIANKRAGVLAGLVFASAPLVVTFARMSLIDMSFSCLLGIALCATAMTVLSESRRWWPWIYISLGLAILDKGPAALALYIIGVTGFACFDRRNRGDLLSTFSKLHLVAGTVIMTAVALPWYVAVGLATNWLWPQVFFFFENVGRFAGHTNHRNPYPWFYLPVLAYGFFPWVLFLPAAIVDALKTRFGKRAEASVEVDVKTGQPSNAGRYALLAASWTLGVLLFFSASMTKLQTYILPAFPTMAILVGLLVDRFIAETSKHQTMSRVLTALLALIGSTVALVAAAGTALLVSPETVSLLHAKWAPAAASIIADTPMYMRVGLVFAAAASSIGMLSAARLFTGPRREQGIVWLTATSIIACTIGAPIAFQLGYKYKDADAHAVAKVLNDRFGPVALYHDFKPALIFHVKRPVDTIFKTDQLHPRLPGEPETQYIITGAKGKAELLSAYPTQLKLIASQGDWSVFESHELIALRLPNLERTFKEHIDLSGGEYSWGTLPFAGGSKP